MTLEPLKVHTPTLASKSPALKQSHLLYKTGYKTPTGGTPARRRSLVYVEIPPSPLHSSSTPKHSRNHSGTTQPLTERKMNLNVSVGPPASGKDTASRSKKRKLVDDETTGRKKTKRAQDAIRFSDEFPNGYFYCHQCHRKRTATGLFSNQYLSPHRLDTRYRGRAVYLYSHEPLY